MMKIATTRLFQIAPGILGAFFLLLAGCDKKDQAGDWAGQTPAPRPEQPAQPAATPSVGTGAPVDSRVSPAETVDAGTARFLVYNVENWLTMDRQVDGKSQKGAPKPEKEKRLVASLISANKPDIAGISEIGNEEDVKDLQAHLEMAGHPMPHFHLNRGSDPTRSLALLSRFPIGKTATRDDLSYRSMGKEYSMQRGILDATVETPAGNYRFLGVHLKSKRDADDGDQEDMRKNEAHLLRREVDAILRDDPGTRLVVYGDFNDTRNSPAISTARGPGGDSPLSLRLIALKDSRGQYWTHHWDYQDVYSRFDYVMVSPALRNSVDWDRSKIIDSEEVAAASDHRPLLVILK